MELHVIANPPPTFTWHQAYKTQLGSGYKTQLGSGYKTQLGSGYTTQLGSGYTTQLGSGYTTQLGSGYKTQLGSGTSTNTSVSAVGKYTLTNVQRQDIGSYFVEVSNGVSISKLVVNLTLSGMNKCYLYNDHSILLLDL